VIDLQLYARISQLHTRYIRVIDDDQLEQWPALFMPDGRYEITTRENRKLDMPLALMSCHGRNMMIDRVTGLRKINVYEPHGYRHHISAMEITGAGDSITSISNFQVVRIMHSGAMSIFATGVYEDRIVESGNGGLLFAERIVITDSRQTDTLLVIPL
jgi:anthranilate 1,2-dioxygenase small subunit